MSRAAAAAKPLPLPLPEDEAGAEPLGHGEAWEREIDRRIDDVRSGRVEAVPVEEVAAKIRAKYAWG